MKRLFVAAAMLASLSLQVASAFDANTLAFYTFDGKTIGSSAIGGIVTNQVDNSKYAGTITALKGSGTTYGTAQWLADAPGRYVFAKGGYRPDCIYTNPACVQVDKLDNNRGIRCAFDSLASDIGNLSEWTVEWFYKLPSGYSSYDSSKEGSWWQLPLWTTYSTYAPSWLRLGESPSGGKIDFRVFTATLGKGINLNMGVTSIADDMWHHIAIRYKSGKVCLVADYTKSGEVSMSIAPTNEPVAMLLPANGTFHGRISCIRVSKKHLSEDEFMVASNDPDCYPRTAFHWGLEGEPGTESPSSISNRAYQSSSAVVNPGQVVMTKYTGFGTYDVDTNGNHSIFCAELPNGISRRQVSEGRRGDVLGQDLSSLRMPTLPLSLSSKQPSSVVQWTTGTKLKIDTSRLPPVESSFTLELFAKINLDAQRTNTQYVTRSRTTVMGMKNGDGNHHVWVLSFEPSQSGDKFTLSAYDADDVKTESTTWSVPLSSGGSWHHLAVTYDQESCKLRFYFDYGPQSRLTLQLATPLRFGTLSTQAWYIGGDLNNHSFDGWVDEVHLVRECLSPDKFIRLSSGLGMMLMFK